MKNLEALYFPWASVRDSGVLKSALLYFDKIWCLSSQAALRETEGEFGELLRDQELAQWIDGNEVVASGVDIIANAIQTDLLDANFLRLTSRPSPWQIYEDKGVSGLKDLLKPIGRQGNKVLVPYEKGESFLVNMALLAMTNGSNRLIPFTDNEEHLTILQYKLQRGGKGQLERLYRGTLERAEIETLISVIGRDAVQSVLPSPEEARDIPIDKIKQFRHEYQEERNKLRDSIFLTIDRILNEEPSISPERLRMRIQTLINIKLRNLEHDASWSTRILEGIRTSLGILDTSVSAFRAALTGVPLEWALAGETSAAGNAVLDYIDAQASVLRTSDVTYLYQVKRKFNH